MKMQKLPFIHYFSQCYVSQICIQAKIMKKLLCLNSREFQTLGQELELFKFISFLSSFHNYCFAHILGYILGAF